MTAVVPITLYTCNICPYAARAQIALRESGAKFREYEIDLQNKPTWYQPKVNPASKVPAIAVGGPEVPADQPSSESIKLRESLAIIEWVADQFPQSALLPKDPLSRYRIRLFTETVSSSLVPAYTAFIFREGTGEALIKALESVQALLPEDAKYAVSNEFTNADVAAAPFLGRLELLLRTDTGVFAPGEGKKLHELLSTGSKFKKLWSYIQALKERESFKETFLENDLLERALKRVEATKKDKETK
ncbi:glutathione S-transferase [Gautieria morchelliformis]|nr:glutathione S-transferase [Gautieria morchelliformis]